MPLTLGDSSFYPPSRPCTNRYLKTSATWPPRSHRQVKRGPAAALPLGVPGLCLAGRAAPDCRCTRPGQAASSPPLAQPPQSLLLFSILR